MNIGTMILRSLAYSADIAAPLARDAVESAVARGLSRLIEHRPSRFVAREDYMRRVYLFGRMGHRFPDGSRALFGGLGATAYIHEILSADNGRSHHSHPWEWAVSVVLTGGYDEEIVEADGTITTRKREPGSIGVLNASTFHRIASVKPGTHTLFVAGPRTPDRAWYFRRPDGSIVHERDYHANLDAERLVEEAWFALELVRDFNVEPIVGDALESAALLYGVERQSGESDDSLRSCVERKARCVGDEAQSWWGGGLDPSLLGQPIMASDGAESRELEVDDGSVRPVPPRVGSILASDGAESRGLKVRADVLPVAVPVEAEPFQIEVPIVEHFPSPGIERRLTFKVLIDGYTFKRMKSGTIYIRQGANWIGTLTLAGCAVRDAIQLRDEEIEVHADAWAHARALQGAQ